jgi:site-specific DNA recombinase
VDRFTTAQQVGRRRERSRTTPGPNTACPGTKRSYLLRSYMTCVSCERRMWGKDNRGTTYYLCKPPKGYVPQGHPPSVWVREEPLLKRLNEFFETEVFCQHRDMELSAALTQADDRAVFEHQQTMRAVREAIEDITARRTRLINSLEHIEEPDPVFTRDVHARAAKLSADCEAKAALLTELENNQPTRPCPALLDLLPTGRINFETASEPMLRRLFDAFRLEIRYDRETNIASCQVTITPDISPIQHKAAIEVLNDPVTPGQRRSCTGLSGAPNGGAAKWLQRRSLVRPDGNY